jgi:hypothetical protein
MTEIQIIDCSDPDAVPEIVQLSPEQEAEYAALRQREAAAEGRAQFAAHEDHERLRVINERARTDPAYAALAELVLKGRGQ